MLIIGVAIFVQFQGYNNQKVAKKLLALCKNLYNELKTWTERMLNVDMKQFNEETIEEGW